MLPYQHKEYIFVKQTKNYKILYYSDKMADLDAHRNPSDVPATAPQVAGSPGQPKHVRIIRIEKKTV